MSVDFTKDPSQYNAERGTDQDSDELQLVMTEAEDWERLMREMGLL